MIELFIIISSLVATIGTVMVIFGFAFQESVFVVVGAVFIGLGILLMLIYTDGWAEAREERYESNCTGNGTLNKTEAEWCNGYYQANIYKEGQKEPVCVRSNHTDKLWECSK